MKSTKLRIGTHNIRGGSTYLDEDIQIYNIDLICLQETKIKDGYDQVQKNCRIICFESDNPQYGLGFLVHKRISNNIKGFWKVCDRICVIQLELSPNKVCSTINVYAPQSNITEKHPEDHRNILPTAENNHKSTKNKSLVYIAGDINARVGSKQVGENFIGKYGYGLSRNPNGIFLVELLSELNLFLANTALKHPVKHRYTWFQQRTTDGKTKKYKSQIHFVICTQNTKSTLQNARSYGGTMTTSDHRLIVCDIKIEWYKHSKPKPQNTKPKFAVTKISKTKLVQIQYQNKIDELITNNIKCKTTPQKKWDTITNIIKNAALETAGLQKKPKHTNRSWTLK